MRRTGAQQVCDAEGAAAGGQSVEAVERLGPAGHGGRLGFYLEAWEWSLTRRLTRSDLTVLEDHSGYCAENWLGKKKKKTTGWEARDMGSETQLGVRDGTARTAGPRENSWIREGFWT